MSKTILEIQNVSKQYRLGQVGTGTISHDLNRFFHKIRGKEDPYLKVTEVNERDKKSKSDYVWAVKDISFSAEEGEVIGIIGRNGAGKSTLLKLLSRITSPSTGSIKIKGRISSLLEVGTGFHQELTGRENIFLNGAILGMTKKEISSKLDEIIEFSGCKNYIDTPVKRYSSGMIVRLGFAVAAHLESELLIVDEVLAVGDLEFQKKCLGKMKDISKSGRTVLFVSHNMSSISQLCSRTILLREGTVYEDGETESVIKTYQSINTDKDYQKSDTSSKEVFFKHVKAAQDAENEQLVIKATLGASVQINNISCGFLIKDNWGQKIGTAYHDFQISKDNMEIEVNIDIKQFLPGTYQIDSALFIPKSINYEYLENSVTINLTNDMNNLYESQNIGAINLDANWRIH